jgi:hypothetical protein
MAQNPVVKEFSSSAITSQEYAFGMHHGFTRSAALYYSISPSPPLNPGFITSLGWYVDPGNPVLCPVKIYIKPGTSNFITLLTWIQMKADAVLVYDGMLNFPAGGWQTIDIAGYMNVGNKIIVLCESNYAGVGASTYPRFRYSLQSTSHEFWEGEDMNQVDGSVGTISPPNANKRPNIQITYIPTSSLGATIPPSGFMATAVSSSQINLAWYRNAANDNVMIAFDTINSFGLPTGTYFAGDPFPGGGTVIYNGSEQSFSHASNLNSSTTYYYKAWSVHSGTSYSIGTSSFVTTSCPLVSTFPYLTDFESSVFPPDCWSLAGVPSNQSTLVSGYGIGSASVLFDFQAISSGNFDLISPELDLTSITNPIVSFDHAYATSVFLDEDYLQLLYSTDNGITYTLLATWLGGLNGPLNTGDSTGSAFVPMAGQWDTKSCDLPLGTNRVMFRAKSFFGNNLYLDNITFQDQPVLWTGSISTNWATAGNWSPSGVPDGTKNVTVPLVTIPNFYPSISSVGIECNSLEIAPNAMLTITSAGKLTVKGNLTIHAAGSMNNQGLLILKGNLDNQNPN